jgi:hypothetical protein
VGGKTSIEMKGKQNMVFKLISRSISQALLLLLCGCNLRSTTAAAPTVQPNFKEESARALACLDGLSSIESFSDAIFIPQEVKCREHISYLRQTGSAQPDLALLKKLGGLRGQIALCHIYATFHVPGRPDKYGECSKQESQLRDDLPGAEKAETN